MKDAELAGPEQPASPRLCLFDASDGVEREDSGQRVHVGRRTVEQSRDGISAELAPKVPADAAGNNRIRGPIAGPRQPASRREQLAGILGLVGEDGPESRRVLLRERAVLARFARLQAPADIAGALGVVEIRRGVSRAVALGLVHGVSPGPCGAMGCGGGAAAPPPRALETHDPRPKYRPVGFGSSTRPPESTRPQDVVGGAFRPRPVTKW